MKLIEWQYHSHGNIRCAAVQCVHLIIAFPLCHSIKEHTSKVHFSATRWNERIKKNVCVFSSVQMTTHDQRRSTLLINCKIAWKNQFAPVFSAYIATHWIVKQHTKSHTYSLISMCYRYCASIFSKVKLNYSCSNECDCVWVCRSPCVHVRLMALNTIYQNRNTHTVSVLFDRRKKKLSLLF